MKTKQLFEFDSKLAVLNDRYAHYVFVWEQFNIDHINLMDDTSNKLTTEIFTENENSKQFNVKVNYLIESHEETQHFILDSLFILSYSIYERYLLELHKFAKSIDNTISEMNQTLDNNDNEDSITIDKFLNRLNIDINNFSNEEKLTLDYIRLRRNRIIHDTKLAQGKILTIISHSGNTLNLYWDTNLRKGRYNIDFTKKDILSFTKLELFDLLNIIRKISSKIDTLVIERLGKETLLNNILNNFIQINLKKIKGLKEEKIQKKFSGYCKSQYSYNIENEILEKINFHDGIA